MGFVCVWATSFPPTRVCSRATKSRSINPRFTQIVATCICLFGFLVTPLWRGWAALVWGSAPAWFLITDPIKLLAYRYLDATKRAAPRQQDAPAVQAANQMSHSLREEVLVVRGHKNILQGEAIPGPPRHDRKMGREHYRSINDFERHLDVNGTHVVKIFLHPSKEEQRKRFLERIDDSKKNWKFSDADLKEREFRDDYAQAYADMSHRDQRQRGALARRARRRQGKRSPDRLPDPRRNIGGARHEPS